MPCTECGESAREKHGGVVGPDLRRDEDGVARYTCLSCVIEEIEEQLQNDSD